LSRAFVKEPDGDPGEDLPELAVSPHRNLVTPEGLRQIDDALRRLDAERAAARAAGERATVARVERDLRYWSARRANAEPVTPVPHPQTVRFGCRVSLRAESGERLSFRIVGEDESDPSRGLVSYLSPLAESLLGASIGDEVSLRGGRAAVVSIE
jgi:transcription elongation GreA/GreB family factor